MEAPPGIDPTETRQPLIIGVVSFVLSVAFLAVAIRTYTRVFMLRQFGIDDGAAIFTFFLIFACGFSVALNVRNGFGTHVYFLTPEQIKNYMRNFYVTIVFYNAGLAGIKMTFLFQYYRVLAIQKMKKVFITAMIFVGAWSISQILVEIFICTPISAAWDPSVKGNCIPNYPQWYINAGGNILTDLIVFILPLPVIGNLKLARGQKYVLLGIFCLGFFTCTISFIRIRFLHITEDFTWENVETAGWSVGELCCGLTCACLPTFRPLVSRFIPALSSRITKSSKYQNAYGFSSKKTASSRHHDVELGGVAGGPQNNPDRYSRRRTGSADSKADLYAIPSYDLHSPDSSRENGLPIQGPKEGEGDRQIGQAMTVPSPMMFRQQQERPEREMIEAGGYKSEHGPVVKTHIEGGQGFPQQEMAQPGGPIEVKCDIVQESQRVEARGFS